MLNKLTHQRQLVHVHCFTGTIADHRQWVGQYLNTVLGITNKSVSAPGFSEWAGRLICIIWCWKEMARCCHHKATTVGTLRGGAPSTLHHSAVVTTRSQPWAPYEVVHQARYITPLLSPQGHNRGHPTRWCTKHATSLRCCHHKVTTVGTLQGGAPSTLHHFAVVTTRSQPWAPYKVVHQARYITSLLSPQGHNRGHPTRWCTKHATSLRCCHHKVTTVGTLQGGAPSTLHHFAVVTTRSQPWAPYKVVHQARYITSLLSPQGHNRGHPTRWCTKHATSLRCCHHKATTVGTLRGGASSTLHHFAVVTTRPQPWAPYKVVHQARYITSLLSPQGHNRGHPTRWCTKHAASLRCCHHKATTVGTLQGGAPSTLHHFAVVTTRPQPWAPYKVVHQARYITSLLSPQGHNRGHPTRWCTEHATSLRCCHHKATTVGTPTRWCTKHATSLRCSHHKATTVGTPTRWCTKHATSLRCCHHKATTVGTLQGGAPSTLHHFAVVTTRPQPWAPLRGGALSRLYRFAVVTTRPQPWAPLPGGAPSTLHHFAVVTTRPQPWAPLRGGALSRLHHFAVVTTRPQPWAPYKVVH